MNILLVDDDKESREIVAEFLQELGYTVTECDNGKIALEIFEKGLFPMVLSDIKMPIMNGLDLLKQITASNKKTHFVLFTGNGDMQSAIEALKAGAYDYLLKPVDVDELALLTQGIEELQKLKYENEELKIINQETQKQLSQLKRTVADNIGLGNVGFFSKEMQDIVELAKKYHTDRSIPVFIQGETGTGKEVIARIIHYGDIQNVRPFIDINCAALTPSLFESELFGYEPGAFTGSLSKGQKGKLDLAQGGTIFLDEVAEIPLELQGKLLRVIQEKEFYRVGGLKKIKTDVRIICATNVDIEKQVQEGKFREDLYYRLKVGQIYLPALRDRKNDIFSLAEMFLKEFSKDKNKGFMKVSKSAKILLEDYFWPGNIRELRNAIEWAVFMYDDVELKDIHLGILHNTSTSITKTNIIAKQEEFVLPPDTLPLDDHINKLIKEALKLHNGNKAETARYLGISRKALYNRLEQIGNVI